MKNKQINLTAAEEVLLAANEIYKSGKKEFTEWELTVKTWELNKNRWGLRGYEEKYPDHKRVMNEVMAGGTQKVIGRSWIERIKPNYYKITSAGLAKAESLADIKVKSNARSLYEYEALSPYINNKIFEKHCKNSSEPKTWLGAAAFLGLKKYDPDSLERKLKEIKESIKLAREWLIKNNQKFLSKSDSTRPITKELLDKLDNFLDILENRFKAQFEAIRSKRKK